MFTFDNAQNARAKPGTGKPGTGTETSMPDLIRQAWPPSSFFLGCLTGLGATVAIIRAAWGMKTVGVAMLFFRRNRKLRSPSPSKQAPSKPQASKLRTTRSLVTASGHQLCGSVGATGIGLASRETATTSATWISGFFVLARPWAWYLNSSPLARLWSTTLSFSIAIDPLGIVVRFAP